MKLEEFGIVVDNFRAVRGVRHFFLSHMHADHTEGLVSTWNLGFIYCSEISAALLRATKNIPASRIKILAPDTPTAISVNEEGQLLCVTTIDANHCPGAVMFLFEGSLGTVLHTGDFRFDPSMLKHPHLVGKKITHLFLDNTFLSPEFKMPSREVACRYILDIIAAHPAHRIMIGTDTLGKEELFEIIAQAFDTKIVVPEARMQKLKIVGADLSRFTTDVDEGFIRLCSRLEVTKKTIEEWNEEEPTIAIIPSGWSCSRTACATSDEFPSWMSAEQRSLFVSGNIRIVLDEISGKSAHMAGKSMFYAPYSLHSSFDELVTFVRALRPHGITGIVPAKRKAISEYLSPFIDITDHGDLIARGNGMPSASNRRGAPNIRTVGVTSSTATVVVKAAAVVIPSRTSKGAKIMPPPLPPPTMKSAPSAAAAAAVKPKTEGNDIEKKEKIENNLENAHSPLSKPTADGMVKEENKRKETIETPQTCLKRRKQQDDALLQGEEESGLRKLSRRDSNSSNLAEKASPFCSMDEDCNTSHEAELEKMLQHQTQTEEENNNNNNDDDDDEETEKIGNSQARIQSQITETIGSSKNSRNENEDISDVPLTVEDVGSDEEIILAQPENVRYESIEDDGDNDNDASCCESDTTSNNNNTNNCSSNCTQSSIIKCSGSPRLIDPDAHTCPSLTLTIQDDDDDDGGGSVESAGSDVAVVADESLPIDLELSDYEHDLERKKKRESEKDLVPTSSKRIRGLAANDTLERPKPSSSNSRKETKVDAVKVESKKWTTAATKKGVVSAAAEKSSEIKIVSHESKYSAVAKIDSWVVRKKERSISTDAAFKSIHEPEVPQRITTTATTTAASSSSSKANGSRPGDLQTSREKESNNSTTTKAASGNAFGVDLSAVKKLLGIF